MSAEASTSSKLDGLKWLVAIALIVGGVVAYNMLGEQSVLIRVGAVLAAVALALFTALATSKGQSFWKFAKEARTELRKVIWPTTNETVRTSIMVIIMVIILGVFLWLLDWVIVKLLSLVTG
ncbi:MAG: preprotein translocase subunit SecE [Kangiellaceae bacterium]|nr:preprotein translocase subunit SecE [Kangiellaceae bacterium]